MAVFKFWAISDDRENRGLAGNKIQFAKRPVGFSNLCMASLYLTKENSYSSEELLVQTVGIE